MKAIDTIKKVLDVVCFLLIGKSDKTVDDGICDFSGQGRDKYGR